MSVSERCPAFNCVRLQAQLRLAPCAVASAPRFERICSHVRGQKQALNKQNCKVQIPRWIVKVLTIKHLSTFTLIIIKKIHNFAPNNSI